MTMQRAMLSLYVLVSSQSLQLKAPVDIFDMLIACHFIRFMHCDQLTTVATITRL